MISATGSPLINQSGGAGAVSPRPPWAFQRRRERSERRERLARRVYRPDRMGIILSDSLLHAETGFSRRFSKISLIVAGSILFHLFFLFGSLLVTRMAKAGQVSNSDHTRIEIAVVKEPLEVKQPPPVPPKPVRAGDPIDVPKVPENNAPPPRRIVGLNLASTVVGTSGPSFAVGNTRMGVTETVAQEPSEAGTTFTPPVRMRLAKPNYPAGLKAKGLEADVVMEVNIDDRGQVTGVNVIGKSSDPEFDEAAVAAAWKTLYRPAERNGFPVATTIISTVRFRLNEYQTG